MGMSVQKDIKELRRIAERAGWEVKVARSGHTHWKPPAGPIIYSSTSPSDCNGPRQLRRMLRKAGLPV